jgi:hypothetical protein
MKNNTAKFKNPLMSALFGMGMPVWTRDDGWIANDGKFGSMNIGPRNPANIMQAPGGSGAPGPVDPMQAPGGAGGLMRPRGGMMGISPFRINTRYTKGR